MIRKGQMPPGKGRLPTETSGRRFDLSGVSLALATRPEQMVTSRLISSASCFGASGILGSQKGNAYSQSGRLIGSCHRTTCQT
jgi:hypothetical protein